VQPPDSFVPHPRNARRHPEKQIAALTESINRVGWIDPVIVNERTGLMLNGHARVELAKAMGVPNVPYVMVDVSPEDEAFVLATFDPVSALAQLDPDAFNSILIDAKATGAAMTEMLSGLARPVLSRKNATVSSTPLTDDATIIEDVTRYDWAENIVVLFSGGRDSSAALAWARINFPKARLVAMYADMGAEFPGFITHVLAVADIMGAEPVVVRTPETLPEMFVKRGWPLWTAPWCQNVMHSVLAESLRGQFDPATTLLLTGGRAKQANGTSMRQADTPLGSVPEYQAYCPMFTKTDDAIDATLRDAGVPLWEGYARGFARTCCWCCPGQRSRTYGVLRREEPRLFDAFQWLEDKCGAPWGWNKDVRAARTLVAIADMGDDKLSRDQAKTAGA